MEKELSEHTYKASDEEALKHLKMFMEFTTPHALNKSLQKTLFAYLLEQNEKGLDAEFKQVVEDHYLLFEFLDRLESKCRDDSAS